MKRTLGILLATVLLGTAAAVEFQGEGDLVITADGAVVGVGEFENGNVELELLAGFTGFATITVVDEFGVEQSTEVTIDEEAKVVLSETLEELRTVVVDGGGELTVKVEESLEASGNMAFGAAVPDQVELPEVALEGMSRAEANHDASQEGAEEGSSHGDGESRGAEASAEGRARGEVAAGEDDEGTELEAGAEGSVGVGLGSKE